MDFWFACAMGVCFVVVFFCFVVVPVWVWLRVGCCLCCFCAKWWLFPAWLLFVYSLLDVLLLLILFCLRVC